MNFRNTQKYKDEMELIEKIAHYRNSVIKNRTLTSEKYIEGIGYIREWGNLNFESILKNLLKNKYIVG